MFSVSKPSKLVSTIFVFTTFTRNYGVSVRGGSLSGKTPPVQLHAGDTHPTGMHSCFKGCF